MDIQISQHESTELITRLFPVNVNGLILPIDDYLSCLREDELEIIKNASNKRKFEFSTGRWCARQLLAQHDIDNISILSGEYREPVWPDEFVGSISHCKDQCGAFIAKRNEIRSIGFDVELQKKLKNNIDMVICTDDEKNWIHQQTSYSFDNLVLLLFSLKESVYKCVFQNQHIRLGFQNCIIQPELENNSAHIRFNHKDIAPSIELRFILSATHIYSSAIYHND